MKYIFIINPIAGNDDKAKIFSRIKSTFRMSNDEMIVESTHEQGDAQLIAKKYANTKLQTDLPVQIHLCFFCLSAQAMILPKRFTVQKI